jgi:hypothetical protein
VGVEAAIDRRGVGLRCGVGARVELVPARAAKVLGDGRGEDPGRSVPGEAIKLSAEAFEVAEFWRPTRTTRAMQTMPRVKAAR